MGAEAMDGRWHGDLASKVLTNCEMMWPRVKKVCGDKKDELGAQVLSICSFSSNRNDSKLLLISPMPKFQIWHVVT
jgi:hypothetical protein